jgi:AcrR family transcriptional regulator
MDEVLDTRSRIKIAAMRLFAERGVEAVTVREIVAASEAKNAGSLNYYFNSKEELISELLTDIFRVSNEDWLDGLTALQLVGGPKSVRDIIHIIVYAPTPHFRDGTAHRFVASLLFTRRKMVSEFLDTMNFSVFGRLLRYIRELTPHISEAVMNQRLIFLAWYVISVEAAIEGGMEERKTSHVWTDVDVLANLEDTAVGLIEAADGVAAMKAKNPKRAQPVGKSKSKSGSKSKSKSKSKTTRRVSTTSA